MSSRQRPFSLAAFVVAGLVMGCKPKADVRMAEIFDQCTHDSEMGCPRPILNVSDIKRSAAYYTDSLGFKLDWEYGEPTDFASVSRANAVFFMCQRCQGHPGSWLMVFVRDVDGLHDEIRAKGARIRLPPTNMRWGGREMQVADPDGNVIRFAGHAKD